MAKFRQNAPCPCGSRKKYKKCCKIFHSGLYPKDVLTLMKSRYSAFAVGEIDYIIKTSINQRDYKELKAFSNICDFKRLDILDYGEDFVTFRATIFCNGEDNSFTERSRFILVDGKWKYNSGDIID
jgi:SEC-C motif-containing protein